MDKPAGGSSATATTAPGAPIQPSSKGSAAAPMLNNEMELGNLPGDGPAAEDDIMQIARIGDVAAMEKLFEGGEYDATFTGEEGITPLHVCARFPSVSLLKTHFR
jgi:palmitoyltransferase ZDHHC13/17